MSKPKNITVGDLIKTLSKVDPKRVVIMSRDAEGNGHSPLASFWEGAYRAETTWSGEVGMEKLTAADRKAGYTEEDTITDGVPAVVLSPTN